MGGKNRRGTALYSLFLGGFCRCPLLAAVGMGHELREVFDVSVQQFFSYRRFLEFLQFSILYCLSLFTFLPSSSAGVPCWLARHWGCATPPALRLKHGVLGYKPSSKGCLLWVGCQAETRLLVEICCFDLYWILEQLMWSSPSWLLPDGWATSVSQRAW